MAENTEAPRLPGRAQRTRPHPTQGGGNRGWWPNQLNMRVLAPQPSETNPYGRPSTTPRRSTASTCPP